MKTTIEFTDPDLIKVIQEYLDNHVYQKGVCRVTEARISDENYNVIVDVEILEPPTFEGRTDED
mgnify:CR=1 FL=1